MNLFGETLSFGPTFKIAHHEKISKTGKKKLTFLPVLQRSPVQIHLASAAQLFSDPDYPGASPTWLLTPSVRALAGTSS